MCVWKGLQWDWYRGCKGMLEGWGAERHRLNPQALEQRARRALEREACIRQETHGRARQWYGGQRQLQGVAKGLAQLAGQLSLERGWGGQAGTAGKPAQGCPEGKLCTSSGGSRQAGPTECSHGGPGPVAPLCARQTIDSAACHRTCEHDRRGRSSGSQSPLGSRHILQMEAGPETDSMKSDFLDK